VLKCICAVFLKAFIFQKQTDGRKQQLDSPAQIKKDNRTDRTTQEDTNSNLTKPAHSPVETTKPGTDHHNKTQPEIPDSKESDKAKKRRKGRRKHESVSYSEVMPH
jgi:hypothetical protein